MPRFDPVLRPVPLDQIRPTQITVGLKEVARKREKWREEKDHKKADYLKNNMVPAVIGPKGRYYIVDHHHLSRALADEGVDGVFVAVQADLSRLDKADFWTYMDHCDWVHPYDADGVRHDFDRIPKHVADMEDDPYRSLAGAVRRAGGFAKDTTPYVEFLWAAYFRRRIEAERIVNKFDKAVAEARELAHHEDADYLPGWCGAKE